MKKTHTLVHLLSKILAFIIRWILRSRYIVSIKGADIVQKNGPVLFLPNHQALTDPIILMSYVYKFSSVSPVISEKYYDVPIAKWYFRQIGAVRVSDLEAGSRDTNVLKVITRSVYKGFKRNKNVVIYPAGQLAGQGYEKIFNKKSAYHIVNKIPDDVQIVGVRLTGLWGSMFSKAKTGKSPDFFLQLLKGFLIVLANLIFFVPKRKVILEFVDLTEIAKEQVLLGQKPFNQFLEDFFNVNGEEQALFLRHFFFYPDVIK